MSLIHWWPLTEDLKDQIGNNNLHIPSGYDKGKISINTAGKIGACYERTSTGTIDLLRSTNKLIALTEQSICFWTYVTQHAALNTANGLVTNHDHSTCTGLGVGVYTSNGTNYYISFSAGDGTNRVHSTYYGKTDIKNSWHHICLVYDKNKKIHLYVDGVEDRNPVTYNLATKSDYFEVFNWSTGYGHQTSYRPICKINDVRVYNHALSKAEIQELKKALIVHYTFDDNLTESTSNLITGLRSGGRTNYDSTNSTITTAGENKDTYFYLLTSEPIVEGLTYTLSCQGKNIGNGKQFIFGMQGQTSAHHQFTITEGHNEFTFIANNYINGLTTILMDDTSRTGWENKAIFSQFQLEKKDHATPYTISNRPEMLYNETGLSQHNNIQNINLSCNAVIGKYALNCNNTCINLPSTGDIVNGATASCWVKVDTYPTSNQVVFADYNSKLAFGFYGTQNAIISCGSHSVGIISNIQTKWKQNAWNHIAIIRTTTNQFICYLNNEQLTLSSSTNNWTTLADCTIGCRNNGTYNTYFHGLIDDFRLYYTQLSPEEIKELYNCGGRISNLGDALTGGFIEGVTATKVNKNHTMEVNEIHEIDLGSDYEQLEYIESTGTQYIDTGYYWQNEKAKIVADLIITNNSSNQTIFGNEERYSGSNRYFAHILHGNNGNFSNYIGTGSVGAQTKLPLNNRYTVEYISHGDHTFSTKTISTAGVEIIYNNKTTYSGTILTHQNSTQTGIVNRGHIFIFANHNAYNGTGPIQQIGGMKLYRFTMIDNNKYVRDFIPCRRKNDSKIGLFDLITNQFYTTPVGEFSTGAVINNNITAKILIDGRLYSRQIIEI